MSLRCPEPVAGLALAGLLLLAACQREPETVASGPPAGGNVAMPTIEPGPAGKLGDVQPPKNPFAGDARAIAAGEKIYNSFGCVGCHAGGGGGMGPALIDDQWIYGSSPAQIRATILEGRPGGMPSFNGMLPDEDVWRLVTYVRALAGLEGEAPKAAAPLQTLASENLENAPQDLRDYYRQALGEH